MADIYYDVDTALAEVPVNLMPLIDDTDFKSIEGAVAYNAAGMALRWHFVTTAGAYTVTSVTPTTAGVHDWTDQGDSGVYTIEIPASGGTINNDTEGFGWFTGVATGILPWRGPVLGFRAAGLNDALIDGAYSTTRGLAGTALPNAAADAAGGLPISDAGGLDLDSKVGNLPSAAAGASGGLLISGSNSGTTTLGALTVTGATTLTGALTSTNASNDLRLGATERGLQRDKIIERTVIRGTAATGTLSTTQMTTTGMSPAMTAANQLAGQILMFDHDTTTAALRGQKTDITASSAAANPLLTFTALTTAPANGDTFTIG